LVRTSRASPFADRGDLWQKYNAALTGSPPHAADALCGNVYTTSLHVLLGALDKLRRYAQSALLQLVGMLKAPFFS
jgi:hypothetical protein